jgi:hypothetical protein
MNGVRIGAVRRARVVSAVLGVLALAMLLSPVVSSSADAAASASSSSAVTKSKTVSRTFLDDGTTTQVGKNTVKLTVSQTTNLRSLQLINVAWSGAHPTGGLVSDQNSDLAQNEEYPMALFECRGTDTATHPLTPETCWTQYADERFNYGSTNPAYPAWRSDAYAAAADRAAVVDAPAKPSQQCTNVLNGVTYQRWVPFIAADRTDYAGGLFGCQGQPPEASPANLTGSLSLPSNETFGATDTSGDGSADFDIFTGEDHASLGCSTTVACTLVAIPVEGISCDAAGANLPANQRPDPADVATAQKNCEQTGRYAPGSYLQQSQSGQAAVDGSLWWSASNWRNRISIPLSFAPPDNLCSLNSAAVPEDIYGSELMIQATTQWGPHFCLDSKLFDLNHVQVPEPQARSLLQQGNISAAFTSNAPDTPYPEPTVNAPTAVSGFGIAYDVDGTNRAQLPTLHLDARLLAKLLTESYPDQTFVKDAWQNPQPAKKNQQPNTVLRNNPLNITQDPEFQALNPGVPENFLDSAATLLTLNSDSDVMYALTSYINADPEARAWLDGKPDPWGMTVNPNYKNIALPVDNWPLLDSFEPFDEYQPGRIDCLYASPVPYLPLVAAPTSRLANIAQDMQFSIAQSQTVCVLPSSTPGSLAGAKMVATGREAAGSRAMFGVVSLGDAARDGLSLASLESTSSVSASKAITDGSGRTFVAPTQASLRAAAKMLVPDRKTNTWDLPYSDLRTSAAGKQAYPGTMTVYTAVPTKGLGNTDSTDLSEFLTFAAGSGQKPGASSGELPAGYLPMTSANGVGTLADYTNCAAAAVRAQQGVVPSITETTCPSSSPTTTSTSPTSPPTTATPTSPGSGDSTGPGDSGTGGNDGNGTGGSGPGGDTGATTGATGTGGGSTSSSSAPSTSPDSSPAPSSISASPVAASTPRIGAGLTGLALPLLFAIAILGGIGALVIRLGSGKRGGP